MSWPDFRDGNPQDWIAVIPVAAIEQHGPHLPLSVDATIAEGYLARVQKLLPDNLPATFLPVQQIGKSDEHRDFPGTLTFSWETLTRAWIELGESVHRAGVRKILFVNSHGGNSSMLNIVIGELREKFGMLAVTTAWHRFGYPAGLFDEAERIHGIHGGEIETSVMMALRPEFVHMDRARNFPSLQYELAQTAKHLRAYGPHAFGWMATDLNPHGVTGNARQADLANGKAMIAKAADGFVELLQDVAAFDVTRFDRG